MTFSSHLDQSLPEVHANAAETLCAITQSAPSALASKLSPPSFIARIFGHALEDSQSKSGLVQSLSVCISVMDPKRLASNSIHSIRNQHFYESTVTVNPEIL
ncbi:Sit4 phosphatase-associated family protein [Thalictrum thalictroides]|uniref:Sit4 phosphatase-associated family protein n=1 Tax=Thalictrum thalictroides TaxID=46969 RepID=A0A7J6X9V0_THATH|nr:Sit4 phosphatase-associated family protein [Thalictrum thalictroides]